MGFFLKETGLSLTMGVSNFSFVNFLEESFLTHALRPHLRGAILKHMAKKSKKSQNRKKSSSSTDVVSIGRIQKTVPRHINTVMKIRRTWSLEITYVPASGFFSLSPNLQINFSGSVSNVNVGGVATFGPTLVNSSEFSNLFDQWRMTQVVLRADWNVNSVPTADQPSAPPLLYVAADYDDSGDTPVGALLQYPGVTTHSFLTNGYSPFIMSLKPYPLKDVAGTGVLTSYAPDTSGSFIRTSELSTPHYGLKIASLPFGATSTSVTGRICLTAYVDLEFVNPK